MPYKGDKEDSNEARPPEGSLVETRCLIKGPKSAIVPFAEPRSGPKSRTGSWVLFRKNAPPTVVKRLFISSSSSDSPAGLPKRNVHLLKNRSGSTVLL